MAFLLSGTSLLRGPEYRESLIFDRHNDIEPLLQWNVGICLTCAELHNESILR